jgi:hypothetical protein
MVFVMEGFSGRAAIALGLAGQASKASQQSKPSVENKLATKPHSPLCFFTSLSHDPRITHDSHRPEAGLS